MGLLPCRYLECVTHVLRDYLPPRTSEESRKWWSRELSKEQWALFKVRGTH